MTNPKAKAGSQKPEKGGLNPKQARFAQEYLKDLNATQAAIRAGYSKATAKQQGARLLTHDDVAEMVRLGQERASTKSDATVSRVMQELSRLGFSDIRKAFDADGNLIPPGQWDDDFAASVASIEVVTRSLPGQAEGELDAQPHGGALARKRNAKVEYIHKIKIWDKNSALEKLAKHLGMFIEKIEHSGPDGGPLPVTFFELPKNGRG